MDKDHDNTNLILFSTLLFDRCHIFYVSTFLLPPENTHRIRNNVSNSSQYLQNKLMKKLFYIICDKIINVIHERLKRRFGM